MNHLHQFLCTLSEPAIIVSINTNQPLADVVTYLKSIGYVDVQGAMRSDVRIVFSDQRLHNEPAFSIIQLYTQPHYHTVKNLYARSDQPYFSLKMHDFLP